MRPRSPPSRTLLLASLLVLACTACGRRGALQSPDAALSPAPTTQLGPGFATRSVPDAGDGEELPPSARPAVAEDVPLKTSRGARRGYTVPKQPFPLDPIL